ESFELSDRQKEGYSTEPLLPLLVGSPPTQKTYDYVLVAHQVDDERDQKAQRQRAFIQKLEEKNITRIEHDDKVFFGIRAPNEMFKDYQYLLKVSDSCNWCGDERGSVTQATRIRIVHFILQQTFINTGENLEELIKKGAFETMFCLHEDNQSTMSSQCLSVCPCVWVTLIVGALNYFGEKVALYYLWLGWYTKLLVPAAALGVVVFLYGLAFFNSNPLIMEVCQSSIIMCPRCDKTCFVWQLSDTCTYAKVSHLFDNEGTVAFAMCMAIWATLFLELWKRHRARHVSQWKVYDWCEEEEELILEIVNDPNCKAKQFRHSYLRSTLVLFLVTVMEGHPVGSLLLWPVCTRFNVLWFRGGLLHTLALMLIIGLAHALVVFRVVAAPLMSELSWEFIRDHANTVAVMMGAVLHYLTIQIMTRVNRWVSLKLCDIEKTNSFAATERNFTVKMFTFQFFTLFSSLFYVAFFLGSSLLIPHLSHDHQYATGEILCGAPD
ncbi:hypothetical protein JOQ06_009888, partial [Pogonophryne albipinna]